MCVTFVLHCTCVVLYTELKGKLVALAVERLKYTDRLQAKQQLEEEGVSSPGLDPCSLLLAL